MIGLGSPDGGAQLKGQEVYFNLLDCKCTLTLVKSVCVFLDPKVL